MPDKEPWRFIGQRIRLLRKSNQLTIKQLANGCGLSSNAISLVERGEVAPTVSTLCKIAHALGLTVSTFFDQACSGEDNSPENPPPGDNHSLKGCALVSPSAQVSDGHPSAPNAPPRNVTGYALPSILCICGQLGYTLDGQNYLLRPGETLLVDPARPHGLQNTGKETGIALLVFPASQGQPAQTEE